MDVDVDAVVADLEEGIRTGRIDQELAGTGGDLSGVDVEMKDGLESTLTALEPRESSSQAAVQDGTVTSQATQMEAVRPVFSTHSIMPTNVSMDDEAAPPQTGGQN